jgi:hypothetical protein
MKAVDAALGGAGPLHLLHQEHAPNVEERGQGLHHGDDGGGGGEARAETARGVEDEGVGEDRRVIIRECIGEELLAVAVLGNGEGALHELTKLVVEVYGLVHLVGGEELEDREPQLKSGLIASEDHVSDVFVDAGVKGVEHRVVIRSPGSVSRVGGEGAIDVADQARATQSGAHVDGPLGVVAGGEVEYDRGDVVRRTPQRNNARGGGDECATHGVEGGSRNVMVAAEEGRRR